MVKVEVAVGMVVVTMSLFEVFLAVVITVPVASMAGVTLTERVAVGRGAIMEASQLPRNFLSEKGKKRPESSEYLYQRLPGHCGGFSHYR